MPRWSSILAVVGGLLLLANSVHAQRREHFGPGLILETGGRTGACDMQTFTRDGKHLLACGDDKVVRSWNVGEKGVAAEQTLRWWIWLNDRGAIYTMALSPDKEQRYVAVAGYGVFPGAVAVLDRATGEVVHALTDTKGNDQAIWTVAFSPSGKALAFGTNKGGVWLWDLASGKKNDVRLLGKHGNDDKRVRLVAFLDKEGNELISVGADSRVVKWDVARSRSELVLKFKANELWSAALSPDHKWLVAAAKETRTNPLELCSLDGQTRKFLPLRSTDDIPRTFAFDAESQKLAVAFQTVPEKADFYIDTQGAVYLYDLRKNAPEAEPGPKVDATPEAIAFHPDGVRLAVAAGPNYEVSIWNTRQLEKGPVHEIVGPGRSLWSVGLSKDGRHLGYQDERAAKPADPNHRGAGAWRVFDLQERRWEPAKGFEPIQPLEKAGGWTVLTVVSGKKKSAYVWYVLEPDGQTTHELPLDADIDEMPRCYTFLPPVKDAPVRLAVGHYWGFSVFELHEGKEPKRVYLGVGHQGYVTSIAPSVDGKLLLTASRDQTIEGWTLAPWPSKTQIGARFDVRLNRLLVDQVDPGSPAWEAGLAKGDEVILMAVGGNRFLYDPQGMIAPEQRKTRQIAAVGDAEECLKRLGEPRPNWQYYFLVRRAGEKEPIECGTTLRQRPLWHFFPTHGGEWVLWRHHDYYYDASARGGALIGWQVSEAPPEKASPNEALRKKPSFFPAEQFAKVFLHPEKVTEALQPAAYAPEVAIIPAIQPPQLTIAAAVKDGPGNDVRVTLRAVPRGERDFMQAKTLVLWIGDHRYKTFEAKKGVFDREIDIPGKELRTGTNRLTLQCYDRGDGCTIAQMEVVKRGAAVQPRLFVLLVGVEIYSATKGPQGRPLDNLPGLGRDLDELEELWTEGKSKDLFREVVVKKLADAEATPANILAALKDIREKAGPDDLFVLYMAGHGYTELNDKKEFKSETFTFAGPTFDITRPAETGLPSKTLYAELTEISSRKLIWLMSCHSGDASRTSLADPIQELSFGGVGPIVFAACQHRESAFVDRNKGSLFAQAIREGFEQDGALNVADLARFVQRRVPLMASGLALGKNSPPVTQTPAFFPDISLMEPLLLKGK